MVAELLGTCRHNDDNLCVMHAYETNTYYRLNQGGPTCERHTQEIIGIRITPRQWIQGINQTTTLCQLNNPEE